MNIHLRLISWQLHWTKLQQQYSFLTAPTNQTLHQFLLGNVYKH